MRQLGQYVLLTNCYVLCQLVMCVNSCALCQLVMCVNLSCALCQLVMCFVSICHVLCIRCIRYVCFVAVLIYEYHMELAHLVALMCWSYWSPEVGDVVGVADSTIRQSYRLLYPSKGLLFPQDFHFATSLEDLPKH